MPAFDPTLQSRIQSAGVIAVLVLDDVQSAVPLARALLAGGIDAMELTLRTPAALDSLRAIRAEVPEMIVGAGTVLTPAQVYQVANAGAHFAVSPGVNPRVLETAAGCAIPFAPGIMTPTDIETALEFDCRLLKFFPAESSGGLPHLKNIVAPYKHLGLQYIPLGGLTQSNMTTYLSDPHIAAVGGSWLAKPETIAARDWPTITETARIARESISSLRTSEPFRDL